MPPARGLLPEERGPESESVQPLHSLGENTRRHVCARLHKSVCVSMLVTVHTYGRVCTGTCVCMVMGVHTWACVC